MNIRNIAIVAHVDHGKTTLVNQLLVNSHAFRSNETVIDRALDSNDIERERGITILAKTTSINYNGYRINILDTPGHADFGGEVERIMNMVDGVLLLVDAFEGTMPQTRFVLKKALEAHIKPVVVVNKIDRPNADAKRVLDEVFNLFVELGASEDLLDFKIVYVSALKGTSSYTDDVESQKLGMDPVLETIISEIPEPKVNPDGHLQFQPALLDYSDYLGKIGIGLVKSGHISVGQYVSLNRLDGSLKNYRIQKLFGYVGLNRIEINSASAGEIVAIAGIPDLIVGETVCDNGLIDPLPPLRIDPPTLQMTFGVNSSPLSGKDGKLLTVTKISERLNREAQKDVSLKVERNAGTESFIVSGRGELHLSILIENMRREGFEIEISKPKVIIEEIDGIKCEPYEDVNIEIPEQYFGSIINLLTNRGGELEKQTLTNGLVKADYIVPTRGLLGMANAFTTLTKGYGILNHTFREYRPMASGLVGERKIGVLVSSDQGSATTYAIMHAEERGVMFVTPQTQIYSGMIVGENKYNVDLEVSVTREKEKSNMRAAGKDPTTVLKSARVLSLEDCLNYINSDELVEITPKIYRMRKKILNASERKKYLSKINKSN